MLTNNKELSRGLFHALSYDPYSKGDCDFSATELITPSRIVALKKMHSSEITEDASDMIYRILGRAVHSVAENARADMAGDNKERRTAYIENALVDYADHRLSTVELVERLDSAVKEADAATVYDKHGIIFEQRFYATIEVNGIKYTISGQVDQYNTRTGAIHDYKLTSRWVLVDNGKDEWTSQMNIYAWLLRMNGHDPKSAHIEAIFRDWSKAQAIRDKSYPQSQVATFDIELWDNTTTEAYIRSRVESHVLALSQKEELSIPVCSKNERWERGEKVAVVKPGRPRAIRVLDTRDEALAWIGSHGKPGESLSLEARPGEPVRCLNYCVVNKFCSFYKMISKEE